jgi:cytochrome c553
MHKIILVISLALLASLTQAADIGQGEQVAKSRCAACHGVSGQSSNPMYPNLAGQHATYLSKQMRDFQSGKRQDPVMNAMLKGVNDATIEDLAAYFSMQK